MTFLTFSLIIFGLASGFGATVWLLVAAYAWRRRHRYMAFWYVVLSLAYLMVAVIVGGRLLGNFEELPRGISLMMLGPIFVVPPAIQLVTWLRARSLIEKVNGG